MGKMRDLVVGVEMDSGSEKLGVVSSGKRPHKAQNGCFGSEPPQRVVQPPVTVQLPQGSYRAIHYYYNTYTPSCTKLQYFLWTIGQEKHGFSSGYYAISCLQLVPRGSWTVALTASIAAARYGATYSGFCELLASPKAEVCLLAPFGNTPMFRRWTNIERLLIACS